jgi:WD40 repeat protein
VPAVEVWENGARVGTLQGREENIWCLTAFHLSDGASRLATGDHLGTLRLYDGDNLGKPLQTVQAFDVLFQRMLAYYEAEQGRPRLVAGSHQGGLCVRDGETLELLRQLEGIEGFIWSLEHFTVEDGLLPRAIRRPPCARVVLLWPKEGLQRGLQRLAAARPGLGGLFFRHFC